MLYERYFYNPFIINILHSITSVKRLFFGTKNVPRFKTKKNDKNFKEHKLYSKKYFTVFQNHNSAINITNISFSYTISAKNTLH